MTTLPLPLTSAVAPEPGPIGSVIDYELFLDCVHCGLCTSACPTYLELGTEMDSPRGRIYLMRNVVDQKLPLDRHVQRHLDLCLDCRACESACPSGVQYHQLLEPFRAAMQQRRSAADQPLPAWQRWLLFHVMTHPNRVRWAMLPVRMMQSLGLDRLLEWSGLSRLIPKRLQQMQAMLPALPMRHRPLPSFLPAIGPRRAKVAFLTGCVNESLFADTNWASVKVLQWNGCDVWIPRDQGCCGALHAHAGLEAEAQHKARSIMAQFRRRQVDAVVVNVAGCGSMMKEYVHLLAHTEAAKEANAFAAKVRDISEFLAELRLIPPTNPLPLRATYHDACHLCHAQQIRQAPRELLAQIPGLELVPLAESEVCCGAAGSYNLVQPDMAERLGARKAQQLQATQAQAIFTANAGCLLQIAKHMKPHSGCRWIAHPMEALWASYSGQWPTVLRRR